MRGHYYQVGVHGPPNPDKHPWVMWQALQNAAYAPSSHEWEIAEPQDVNWSDDLLVWMPWEPPSELAPEPEDQGVEVDGRRYRLDDDGNLEVYYLSSVGWVLAQYRHGIDSNELAHMGRVAQALGLVDQPPVPRALVDWLRKRSHPISTALDSSTKSLGQITTYGPEDNITAHDLLRRIEAGEFGPVEGER